MASVGVYGVSVYGSAIYGSDTWPAVKVEVAFGAGALDLNPTWTDITDHVLGWHRVKGRSPEQTANQPGTLTLDVMNDDGRFTPGDAASPYYPNVTLYTQVRVRATWAGVTTDLFRGHVEAWPLAWDRVEYGTAQIQCVDGLGAFGVAQFGPRYVDAVLADTPVIYYRMDGDDSTLRLGANLGSSESPTVGANESGSITHDTTPSLMQTSNSSAELVASVTTAGETVWSMWGRPSSSPIVTGTQVSFSVEVTVQVESWQSGGNNLLIIANTDFATVPFTADGLACLHVGGTAASVPWRGVGPLSVASLDSTQVMFTQAPAAPQVRPVSGHLDSLFTSSAQTAIDLTTGEGLTLENSLKDAHNNGYKLALRLRGGERWPHWTASDPTFPVNVWVTQDPAAPGTTRATPAYATDVPMPWNSGASTSDIPGAVSSSNWRHWHDLMMGQVADWLNGTCPLATDGHTRAEHVHYIPVTACSTYSTELQIASSINDANLRTYITGNSSTITGNMNVKAAWEACFEQCIDVLVTAFPTTVPIVFSGANMGWDSGAKGTRSQFVIADYLIGKGYGTRVVAHRTDLRYSYFLTSASGGFGGGIDTDYSPYSWLQYCYANGFGLAIQTAGDGDNAVLAGSSPATEADRVIAYVKTIEAVTNDSVIGTAAAIAPLSEWLAIETTSSMTHPRAASGGTYTTGYHTTIPAVGGFAGGDFCIAEYLYSATTDVQDRLVTAAGTVSGPLPTVALRLGSGTSSDVDTGFTPTVGTPHHYVLVFDGIAANEAQVHVYIDGQEKLNEFTSWSGTANIGALLGVQTQGIGSAMPSQWGIFDEWSIYDHALTAEQVAAHYRASSVRQELDAGPSNQQVGQVLDSLGWPATWRTLENGTANMADSGSLDGRAAQDVLNTLADAELGEVFVDGSGVVQFQARDHRVGAAAVATFGDGPGETPYLAGLQASYDVTWVQNDARVTVAGGSTASAVDTTVPVKRPYAQTFALASLADAQLLANAIVARYGSPALRIEQVTVDCASHPDSFGTLLGLELGDTVVVNRRPAGASLVSVTNTVEQVDETVSYPADGPPTWKVVLGMAPAPVA